MGAPVKQEGPWAVGRTTTSLAYFLRPNDTTQYSAGDQIADSATALLASPIIFKGMAAANGGGGIIQSALFIDSVAAATKPDLELYLFTSQVAAVGDNAAWNPTDLEMLNCIGVIAFATGSFKTCGANGIIPATNPTLAYNCGESSTVLIGQLVARNAYTPTALERFDFKLQTLLD